MELADQNIERRLLSFAGALVDQAAARTIVKPMADEAGFWFGSGSAAVGPDGALYLSGRFRNRGDSRTGVGAGDRGAELAIYRARSATEKFEKVLSFTKEELHSPAGPVISIEGSALRFRDDGVELFVSTEKAGVPYPPELSDYQKPGTGRWTIDRLVAGSIESLTSAEVEPMFQCDDPRFLHVKDPLFIDGQGSAPDLAFCTHPFNWSSANSAFAARGRAAGEFEIPDYRVLGRGFTWDVAISRLTGSVAVPRVGPFRELPQLRLVFYDGGECMRNLDEHAKAVKRPRGYSCEELGGLAYMVDDDPATLTRISVTGPSFVSPYGTGCSRYVDVLATESGYFTSWQQSQADRSQPLVATWLSREGAERFLID